MSDIRSVCEYCSGNTKMNDYGQCRACGAPKPTIPQMGHSANPDNVDWARPGGVWTVSTVAPIMMTTSAW